MGKKNNVKTIKQNRPLKVVSEKEVEIIKINKQKNKTTKLFATFIFVLFIIYLSGYFFGLLNRKTTGATTVVSGNIDLIEPIDGVIIRDEALFKTEKEGSLLYYATDLEKVQSGTCVAVVQDAKSQDIQNKITQIDSDIWKLQEFGSDLSLAQKDAKRIDDQIAEYISSNIFGFSTGDVSSIYTVKSEIDKKVDRRNQILLEDGRSSLKNLADQKELALSELSNNSYNIITDKSGIVCYSIDGFEEVFNFDMMASVKKEQIKTSSKNDFYASKQEVKPGDSVFKLISSNNWYIGAYIKNDLIENLSEDEFRTIYVKSGKTTYKLLAQVKKIVASAKESYVLFEMRKNILDFIDKRFVTFNLTQSEDDGLKIPRSSIKQMTVLKIPLEYVHGDEFMMVDKVTENGVSSVPVSVHTTSNDYCWIFEKYDIVKLSDVLSLPQNAKGEQSTFKVEESLEIYGVYKINSGVAKFIQIFVDKLPTESDSYVIISPDSNKSLRNYDIIATDALSVEDGEKIYR